MTNRPPRQLPPGASILGGAAAGLSYEGAMRDAVAREERQRRQEAGRQRGVPVPQQQQAPRREVERVRG
ncbi:MAG TPA: hypothetical protein VE684_01165 [Crenalkalicoccus sp.]|nr:hypothetical protein [Crenalkalicoccus sp.]